MPHPAGQRPGTHKDMNYENMSEEERALMASVLMGSSAKLYPLHMCPECGALTGTPPASPCLYCRDQAVLRRPWPKPADPRVK